MRISILLSGLFFCLTASAANMEQVLTANLGLATGQVVNGGPCEVNVFRKNAIMIDHSSQGADGYWISSDTLEPELDGAIDNNKLIVKWPQDVFTFHFDPQTLKFTRFEWPQEEIDCRF